MQRIADFIRNQDIFGEPVTLNIRGSEAHTSLLGGFCTLILATALSTIFIIEIHTSYSSPNYFTKPSTNLFHNGTFDGEFTIDTKSSVLAIQLVPQDSYFVDPSQID